MSRKKDSLKIAKVTFKYTGTDNDLTLFLKAVVHGYLVKNNIISDKPFKYANHPLKQKLPPKAQGAERLAVFHSQLYCFFDVADFFFSQSCEFYYFVHRLIF
jgi:hypothetical protein